MSVWDKILPNRFNRNQRKEEDKEQNKQANSFQPLSHDFWRTGRVKALENILTDKERSEKDLFSGYLFAALDLRKTVFSEFCEENIVTRVYNDHSFQEKHLYLDLIESSNKSTEFDFWNDIMSDWDTKGEFYLFILRRVVYKKEKDKDGNYVLEHLGKPVSIEVLDANQVNPLKRGGKVVGYEQWVDASHRRVFAPEQIIHVMNKNPFQKDQAYSIFDIAKDYQYTMNRSSDFTKAAIVNNTNTPGILSTDQVLNDQEYDNLVAQINSHEAGKLIFSDGSGKLNYTAISQELDKSALPDVADVNRQIIFAITGTSKTMLGIEESGTTRDTASVQTEKFLQRVIRPMAKRVISALNFDYRIRYPGLYKADPIDLIIKGTVDTEAAKDTYETQKYLYDSVTEMVYAGYTAETAEQFLKGDISYIDLEKEEEDPEDFFSDNYVPPVPPESEDTSEPAEEPTEEPENAEEETDTESPDAVGSKPLTMADIEERKERIDALEAVATAIETAEINLEEHNHHHEESLEEWIDSKLLKNYRNENGMTDFGQLQSSKLKNIYKSLLGNVRKTQLEAFKQAKINRNAQISDIRTDKQEKKVTNELYEIFKKSMTQIIPIVSAERKEEDKKLNLTGNINVLGEKEVKSEIERLAMKCAESHASTIYKTILSAIEKVEKKKNAINLSEEELSDAVKRAYLYNSKNRAGVVSEDVFMRAVNTGRYYTDYLLLEINGKMAIAYKTLENDYPDPCPLCDFMIAQPMRPFKEDFINWKDDLTVKGTDGKTIEYHNNFEAVKAGDLHVGCRCMYSIVLKETDIETNDKN